MDCNDKIYEGVFLERQNNLWGCVDIIGNTLIPCKYDIVSIRNYGDDIIHIICGYNGEFFTGEHGEKEKTIYTGIYDLYDIHGNLLIGGFCDYEYDKITTSYSFLFGKQWKLYPKKTNSPWSYNHYECAKHGKWIVLSADFIISFNYSLQYIDRLTKSWFTSKCSLKGGVLHYKNNVLYGEFKGYTSPVPFPSEVLFDRVWIANANTIVGVNHPNCANEEKYIICISNHIKSKNYSWTETIDEHYSFVYQNRLGLVKDGKEVLPCDFTYISKPINGWVFLVKKYPFIPDSSTWGKYFVLLYKVKDHYYSDAEFRNSVVAIRVIEENRVKQLFNEGVFELHQIGDNNDDLKSYAVSKKSSQHFTTSFLEALGTPVEKDETSLFNQWCSAEVVEKEIKRPAKDYDSHDYYGLKDALDGEIDAYWNID